MESVAQRDQSVAQQISNAMVQLYKEQFGRGPTKARTDFAGPDALVCTLRETLTPAEQSMVRLGEHQRLRDVRLFFQYATEDEFREIIERATGREVVGFVSGIDTKADIAVELFYLQPEASQNGNASRNGNASQNGDA